MKTLNTDHDVLQSTNTIPGTEPEGADQTGKRGQRRRLGRLPLALVILAVALPLIGGCVAYVHTTLPIVVGGDHYGHPAYYGRPSPQYFCYDCHGYTYFDPYYDYCMYYGFRFTWNHHPSVMRYYREHYDVIHRDTPNFGNYKYKPDYRRDYQYNRPPDYQTWKKSEGGRNFYSGRGSRREQPQEIEQPQGKPQGKQQGGQQGKTEGGRRGQPPEEESRGKSGGESRGR